jgi:hypothetical protein
MFGRFRILALLLVVPALVACGGGGDDDDGGDDDFQEATPGSEEVATEDAAEVNGLIVVQELVAGEDTRFAFALVDQNNLIISFGQPHVRFYYLPAEGDPEPRGDVEAVFRVAPEEEGHTHETEVAPHAHDASEARGIYTAEFNFDEPGNWGAEITVTGEDGATAVSRVGFPVLAAAFTPAVGMDAPPSDNPTAAEVADISEIDSGSTPNDMHDVKIKDAIAAGRPMLIVFSTPAFCLSRFCGPVNDEMSRLQEQYRDQVDFVHIEIWKDYEKKIAHDTALEWLQEEDGSMIEPRVYLVDHQGKIFHRFENMVLAEEVEPWLQQMLGGAAN